MLLSFLRLIFTTRNNIFLYIILLLPTFFVQSKEIVMDELLSLTLEDLMKVKVSGATLTLGSQKQVPSAVTIFTHQQLVQMGVDNLEELMNLVPGFEASRSTANALSSNTSSRGWQKGILVIIDGNRLEESGRLSGIRVAPKLHLNRMAKIEFIRGPGSAVYGANAMVGVINITTRKNVNDVEFAYGSFNHKQVNFFSSFHKNQLSLDLYAHGETSDGEDYFVRETYSADLVATKDPYSLIELSLNAHWQKTALNFQYFRSKTDDFFVLGRTSNDFNSADGEMGAVSVKHDFTWFTIKSTLALYYKYSNVNLATKLLPAGALSKISEPSSEDALYADAHFGKSKETRLTWQNNWQISSNHSFQFGTEYRYIDIPDAIASNNFDLADIANGVRPVRFYNDLQPTTVVEQEFKQNSVGVYLQDQYQLFDKTKMTLGARYDYFSHAGNEISPRFSLVHEFMQFHSVKLLYGEAFRSPASQELSLKNNPVVVGNPELAPESVKTRELIWLVQWPKMQSSLGYFDNQFDNAIVTVTDEFGVRQIQNTSHETSKGFEFELSYELNRQLLIRTTFTQLTEHPDVDFTLAKRNASLMLNYQYRALNFNLIAIWTGKRDTASGPIETLRLNDNLLLFGKVNYQVSNQWKMSLQVKNLLDETYFSSVASPNLSGGIPNRGMEVLLGITWSFK